jgi:hypothetical protein
MFGMRYPKQSLSLLHVLAKAGRTPAEWNTESAELQATESTEFSEKERKKFSVFSECSVAKREGIMI